MAPAKSRFRLVPAAVLLVLQFAAIPAGAGQQTSAAEAPRVSALEAEAGKKWDQSVHGAMLRRILPPGPEPGKLPEPDSLGAQLHARYCVQCHNLPSPQMHAPDAWPKSVNRMVWRMQGKGNMGKLMKEMMEDIKAPTRQELSILTAYLQKHGQRPIDPRKYPDLKSPEGLAFDAACSQCHALPDPKRHTAKEWTEVVERMQKHLEWVGRVKGKEKNPRGEIKVEDILKFLQRHSRAS